MGLKELTAKRFIYDSITVSILKDGEFWLDGNVDTACNHSEICNELNKLAKENEQLKYKINDLLYQIEYVGKNNKSCDGCECFLEDIGYCWMWDMNVKKEDIVVACDKRKVMKE